MELHAGQLARAGYVVVPQLLEPGESERLLPFLDDVPLHGAGARRLIEIPWCAELGRRIARDSRELRF